MRIRAAASILSLTVSLLCCAQISWAQASPGLATSIAEARRDGRHTLFVELRHPYERSRTTLRRMLKDEGYESFAEGEREIVLVLTAEQIGRLFQGRIHYRATGASASDRVPTVPYLDGARIPGRFGKWIRRVYFDPQRG